MKLEQFLVICFELRKNYLHFDLIFFFRLVYAWSSLWLLKLHFLRELVDVQNLKIITVERMDWVAGTMSVLSLF